VIPKIDPREIGCAFHGAGAEIAEKGNFWMENRLSLKGGITCGRVK